MKYKLSKTKIKKIIMRHFYHSLLYVYLGWEPDELINHSKYTIESGQKQPLITKAALTIFFCKIHRKYLCWSLTQLFSCECKEIFKNICFEEHMRTASSIRCYFDTINLKQSGFCATCSIKVLVSEWIYKNNLKK